MADYSQHPEIPSLGTQVIFFNADKQAHAAFIAWRFPDNICSTTLRPLCNLTILLGNGKVYGRKYIAPAYEDEFGTWHVLEKWAYPDEVPTGQYNADGS